MPIPTAEERVGTLLGGRYRLDSILGTGGTSTVYRALHTFTNRPVAVKLLKPEHSRDRDLVARFLKEARVASTIAHPNVVTILDMGTDVDTTYLAMELLPGESLATRLARVGALPADEAVKLLRPLLEAVAAAHDKGVVHRDIKPENVLVGDRGDGVERAVLLDFGMAKTTESAWGHMTQSGVLVGTPYYMSPEQAEGAPDLGPATDVWSMGVLLYRALSGELPFTGSTPTALLLAIARGDHMRLGDRVPTLSRPIAAWVEGALVSDRERRYPDMSAMLGALDAAQSGAIRELPASTTSGVRSIAELDVGVAPVVPPSRTRVVVAAGFVAVVALAAAIAFGTRLEPSVADVAAPGEPVASSGSLSAASHVSSALTDIPPATAAEVEGPVVAAPEPPAVEPPVAEPAVPARGRAPRPPRVHVVSPPSGGAESPPSSAPSVESGLVTEW